MSDVNLIRPASEMTPKEYEEITQTIAAELHDSVEGLAGDDVFTVEERGANAASKPSIRIYGGAGTDAFRATGGRRGVRFSQESAPAKRAYDKPPEE